MMFGKKKAGAIAAGLSLVMALSPVAAFADETPAAAATGVKIGKTVTMNAGSTLTSGFKFTVAKTQLFANTENATAPESDVPAIDDVEIASQDWTSTTGKVEKALTLPEKSAFPHAGVYAWTVTEATNTYTAGENEELTYNTGETKTYTLVAVVSNDSDTVTWGFYNGTPENADAVKNVAKTGEADFTNKYVEKTNNGENKPLVVKKTVTGAQGDKTKQFNFTVTLTAPENVPNGWSLSDVSVTPKTGSKATVTDAGTVQTAEDGTQTRTIKFTAADSESVTFDNVVVGTTYTVAEDSYSTEGYTTTGTFTDAKTLSESGAEEEVVNDKASSVVTGVIMNNAPFIVMIGAAAAGVVAYGSAKRKLEK